MELPYLPVYRPDLTGNEKRYVNECLDTTWISSIGTFIDRFEAAFRETTEAPFAWSVSNGTVALHLAIHCLDIGPGDEVIVPTFTYIASVNAITQTGATPVFVECKSSDWLIDVADVKAKISPRTKAIMAVHLYGAVCDMAALSALAKARGLFLIEDCAEALGSTYQGKHVGLFGDVGTFSFFGNKTVTTGEGGMVVCNDEALARRMKIVKGQGQSPNRRYWHVELGFNYRMTNICAAIGLAQLERLPAILQRKRDIGALYRRLCAETLGNAISFQDIPAHVVSSDWLVSALLPERTNRDAVMAHMQEKGVDTRPVFFCAHKMPVYLRPERFPVSEAISVSGISLPSYPTLSDADVSRIVETLAGAMRT